MTAEKSTVAVGWRVYGLGVMALGMLGLAWGDFLPGQPVPKNFPDRSALAYAAAAFMLVAGAAVEWRRTAAWGAAALTAYYALIVVILMNGRVVLAHYAEFGAYSGVAEQLAIAAGGVIIYAATAKIDAALAARLTRAGPAGVRGVCAVIRRSAFFLYEPDRPAGPQMAAAYARVLGLCDRDWPHRGGRGDPDGRAGPPRRDPADRHVRVLHPAGAPADAPGRSLQPLYLERERLESRPDRRRLGRGGLAGAAEALVEEASMPLPRFLLLLLGLSAASVVNAAGFDSPEDAVRALEKAYVQKSEDDAVAAMDFVEEGRQMLQKINPALANDAEIIKQTAASLEQSFRNELRTKGFPDFAGLKCSFVAKAQISPELVKLTEQCVSADGGKSVQDRIVTKRDLGWRVTLPPPPVNTEFADD